MILLTAKDSLRDKEEGYESGADSYLTKPFSAKLLVNRINNLLRARRRIAAALLSEAKSVINQGSDEPSKEPMEENEDVSQTLNSLDREFIDKIRAIIDENLSYEELGVAFLADKMCMSSSTLYRKIMAIVGVSTNEYIRRVRLGRAAEMLVNSGLNITDIAFQTGFGSHSSFAKAFKKEFGMTASEYVAAQKQINQSMRKFITLVLLLAAAMTSRAAEPVMPTVKGEPFIASDGKHINAHGGAILLHDGTYYWYGENRGDGTPGKGQKGVACYTSTDLKNWDNKGIVLAVTDSVGAPLERGCIIERPKVVYNPATGKFVMWFHHELKGVGYGSAYSGVAVSDSPTGPFVHLNSGRINPGIYPENLPEEYRKIQWPKDMEWWTPEWRKAVEKGMFTVRDLDGGQMARDMTVFVDDDGKAYHVYSSEENLTLNIAELDSTYTRHTGRYIRIFPGGHNEAPALFKHNGTYWMITSGLHGLGSQRGPTDEGR